MFHGIRANVHVVGVLLQGDVSRLIRIGSSKGFVGGIDAVSGGHVASALVCISASCAMLVKNPDAASGSNIPPSQLQQKMLHSP